MFKQAVASKLFKQSLKGAGIHIGQTEEEEVYVEGKDWVMWFDAYEMPKEIKGELISLCGDLPKPGSAYVTLPCGSQQTELVREDMLEELKGHGPGHCYNPSRIRFVRGENVGVVMWSSEAKEIMIIDSKALSLIVKDDEGSVRGPFRSERYIYWKSETMVFGIGAWPRGEEDEEAERFLAALEKEWI